MVVGLSGNSAFLGGYHIEFVSLKSKRKKHEFP